MDKKKIIHYFGAMQFLLLAMNGPWSYCIIYFRELGFDSREIGMMSSVATFLGMGFLPLMGVISDEFLSPKKLFLLMSCALIPSYLAIPVLGFTVGRSFLTFLLVVSVITMTRQAANSMLDSWAGEAMDRLQVSFGNVRRFGSLGYVVTSLVASAVVGPLLPTWSCCILMPSMGILMLVLAIGPGSHSLSADTERKRGSRPKTAELLQLVFRNYYFVTYLMLAVAFDAFLGIVNLDMTYLMDYAGTAQSNVGMVGAVRAATEIAVMVWLGSRKKLPPYWVMLGASGLLVAAEHLLYPLVHGLGGMVAVTLCSGVAGGMYYGFGTNYVFQIVDHRAATTAISVLGLVQAAMGVLGNAVGGELIAASGVLALTNTVGILVLVLSAGFLSACVLGRVIWKKPYDAEVNVG